jgi:hypothetical protein
MALRPFLLTALLGFVPLLAEDTKKPEPEPRLLSVYPLTIQKGKTSVLVVRGTAIQGATSVELPGGGLNATIRSEAAEPAESERPAGAGPTTLLHIEVTTAPDAEPGDHALRLICPTGLSNTLNIRVSDVPVTVEKSVTGPLESFPVTLNGRISNRGENDAYWIRVDSGETLTFEATSGNAAFDPSISIHEPSGSWFDAKRLNRIGFNDEPLHFPGLSSNPRLVHTFTDKGKYCVNVGAFSGQGGPDYVYELRITRGTAPAPPLHPKAKPLWDERQFTRSVSGDWISQIASRSGAKTDVPSPELFQAAPADSATVPVMSAPGIIQGRLTKAAEVHTIRLRIDKPQDLAFEIETPEATMPRFNPVVRVMEPGGAEIVTNVQTKLNNNGLYMMKMIQPKVTVSLRNPGEFLIQVRDITTDCSAEDFAYRLLVRPQIPHVGRITVGEDALSITTGATKALNLTIEREEEFTAPITFFVEDLPRGLSAVTAISKIEEKPLLFNGGKMERYTPKTQKTVLLVTAAGDTPVMTGPVMIRVVARPFVNGTFGEPISVKEIPLMVLPRSSS